MKHTGLSYVDRQVLNSIKPLWDPAWKPEGDLYHHATKPYWSGSVNLLCRTDPVQVQVDCGHFGTLKTLTTREMYTRECDGDVTCPDCLRIGYRKRSLYNIVWIVKGPSGDLDVEVKDCTQQHWRRSVPAEPAHLVQAIQEVRLRMEADSGCTGPHIYSLVDWKKEMVVLT